MKTPPVPKPPPPAPPGHLSAESQELWRAIVPSRALSPGRLALLATALEARDRATLARLAIAGQGMMITNPDTGMQHINPMLKVEHDGWGAFCRAWALLGLGFDGAIDGRQGRNEWRV